jgi:hypothetical protein
METLMTETLKARRRGYIRFGKVRVEPIKRSSDWLPGESDSAFMNTGAKIEYVVPRLARSGMLVDPLEDLTTEQKDLVARELGFKGADDLNVNKKDKENFWVNRPVFIDKNGKFLDLSNIGDFISYKILEVNYDTIAPSYEERYNKGTFKFALLFEEEKAKIGNSKLDAKKSAYMLFGKIDGSAKKMSDFMWIYYLTDKEAKRLPNNPSIDYLRGEIGRVIEEKTGTFLSIMSDENFEDKVLIQKSINNSLITRDGQMFTIFGEPTSKNTLEGLIGYLKDERNNNIRLSLLGKLDAIETQVVKEVKTANRPETMGVDPSVEFLKRLEQIESLSKDTLEKNNELIEKNVELAKQNEELQKKVELLSKVDQVKEAATKEPARKGPKPGSKRDEFKLPDGSK